MMKRFGRVAAGVASLILLSTVTTKAVEIIAHRGASYDAPENSMSAMKLGWEQRADAIELDLWLSKDGKLIVFHDADTKRFEKTPRKIPELTLEEAAAIDIGSWKGAAFKDERMPRLEPILETIPKNRRAVLEIKPGPEIVPEFVRVIRGSRKPPEELAVISFNYESLKASKKALPKVEHYFLHSYKKDAKTGKFPELQPLIDQAKEARFEGLNLHFDWPIDREFVKKVRAAGLKLYVWTVDDAVVAKRMLETGVDGITTNRPLWLREQLAATPKP